MYGGENSGTPLGPDPINNETGTFGADNDYDQPAAITSGGEDGGTVAFDSNNKNSSAKYFGRRSREKTAKSKISQADAGFIAANKIASNPNNPEFFRQAALQNTPAPVVKESNSNLKKIFIGAGIGVAVLVIVLLMINFAPSMVAKSALRTAFNKYANYYLYGEEKNDELPESFDAGVVYKAQAESGNVEYVIKLDELRTKLNEEYDKRKDDLGFNDDQKNAFEDHFNIMSFVMSKDKPTSSSYDAYMEISKQFLKDGYEATKKTVHEKYDKYIKGDSSYLEMYADTLLNRDLIAVEMVNLYNEKGCLLEGNVPLICMQRTQQTEAIARISEMNKERLELSVAADDMINSLFTSATKDLWEIKEVMK